MDIKSLITKKYSFKSHPDGGKYSFLFNFNKLSSIVYLLNKTEISVFHNNRDVDETWNLIEGGPIVIHLFIKGEYKKVILTGNNTEFKIFKGTYYAVENENINHYSITVRTFSSKINVENIIIPKRGDVLSLFPEYKKMITRLTN